MPYVLQWECSIEGCLRRYNGTAHRCGLGSPWPSALGTGSQFHHVVVFSAGGIQRLVSASPRQAGQPNNGC
jgi:hypothetical protein